MGVTGVLECLPLQRECPSEQVLPLCPLRELGSSLVPVAHVAPADLAVE